MVTVFGQSLKHAFAAEQWCADPADGPGPVVQPPPAACTLDADAQAKAGLYAGMRVELCKIV